MYCLVYFEGVVGRQERYGIVNFGIVEDFWGNLIERSGRPPWLCDYRMSVTNGQKFDALGLPCIAPVSSIVSFMVALLSALSAASFLPMNLFLGCLCLCSFSALSSASTAFPTSV